MVRSADEIPVTYLNKGQVYTIFIKDTRPGLTPSHATKYRTFVRISFEDGQQRQRPAACWQLWKEGRGTNEAHHRGGRLQAVEHVNPSQGGDETIKRSRIDLESASFDGFSVQWTAAPDGSPEWSISVRFNFLSTDFSHSKGVKGIPVRLCAKTEAVPLTDQGSAYAETSYCRVKLFRDHGAERKLSNDVAHVKKSIEKLQQQVVQADGGAKDVGKSKKRKNSVTDVLEDSDRPAKMPKHKRTWSLSCANDLQGGRAPVEEDLHTRLAALQDMFGSTKPVSVLNLRGAGGGRPRSASGPFSRGPTRPHESRHRRCFDADPKPTSRWTFIRRVTYAQLALDALADQTRFCKSEHNFRTSITRDIVGLWRSLCHGRHGAFQPAIPCHATSHTPGSACQGPQGRIERDTGYLGMAGRRGCRSFIQTASRSQMQGR